MVRRPQSTDERHSARRIRHNDGALGDEDAHAASARFWLVTLAREMSSKLDLESIREALPFARLGELL